MVKIANRINRLIQRERQQISPKTKRLTFLDSKAIKIDRIPKTSKTFCMIKRLIDTPRIQGIKKKASQISRTKPIQTLEQRVINDFRCAISYLLQIKTDINQCLAPLDFPNSFLSLSIFLKKIQVNQSLAKAISSNNNQTPQDLMSATFLNRILKNRTEITVQARLKRAQRMM